jgi:hypothetical protein
MRFDFGIRAEDAAFLSELKGIETQMEGKSEEQATRNCDIGGHHS